MKNKNVLALALGLMHSKHPTHCINSAVASLKDLGEDPEAEFLLHEKGRMESPCNRFNSSGISQPCDTCGFLAPDHEEYEKEKYNNDLELAVARIKHLQNDAIEKRKVVATARQHLVTAGNTRSILFILKEIEAAIELLKKLEEE